MERSVRTRFLLVVGALLLMSVFWAAIGFALGDRFADGVRRRIAAFRTVAPPTGWSVVSVTDLPRYEFARIPLGDSVLIIGGFHSKETKASLRVEVLHLATGAWTRRRDMPVGITHATPVRLGDTVWIVGGFEGDHPGPATRRVWRYSISSDAWLEGPSLPSARAAGTLVAIGDTLYFAGGYLADRNTDSEDHWSLAPGDSLWKPRARVPSPRGHASSLAVNDNSYFTISGNVGHDPVPVDSRVVEAYNAATDSWSSKRSPPFSLSHTEPSTFAYNGGIMSAGGRSREIGRENNREVLWYSPQSDRWRFVANGPVAMLGGLAMERRDTLYYGFGAASWSVPTTHELWKRGLRDNWHVFDSLPAPMGEVAAGIIGDSLYVVGAGSNETLIFDLALGRWLPLHLSPVRPARGNHHAGEIVDNKWYLFGGFGDQSEGLVQMFDPVWGRWELRAAMPFAAGSSSSALVNGKVYVAGGIVSGRTTAEAAVYDPQSNTWRRIAPMPRPRNHAASGTDGERFFVFGGRGPGSGDSNVVDNGFDDVQVYDPATDTWQVSDGASGSPLSLPVARGGTGKAAYLNGEFWIVGGETLTGEGADKYGSYARVDVFNPATNAWRRAPDLLHARHGVFPVVDHGRILVVGGGMRAGFSLSNKFEVIWPSR